MNRSLGFITTNAQSLRNKMDEFKTLVRIRDPKIISITESWGKEWISDGIFSLPGFSLYRNDRDIKQGGGTLLYINDKLEHRACRPLNTPDSGSSVWCWVIEKKNGKKTLVGSVYRSTSNTAAINKLVLDKLEKASDIVGENRLLILGDFNVPDVDWEEN